ncbi:hypothetical protein BCR33DRAFT_723189 [Rhizoclosmatium globosum]|uniref:Apple domain-containing protein n=1 Tax=Rhizoclosmatium globosum TaxID=329046 RepID=A0A1Y2BHM1_9FUNG|nr:hypothetical protein BCR33DRAFT_723189 [Rhizoclosmatium globosum]|eukprot:ORY33625.1 hypothetical protein BCR33DRAFT_723189 [Rhizoclosmatium globosum]
MQYSQTILLLLFASCTTALNWVLLPQTDYPGNDLPSPTFTVSPEVCENYCQQNPSCVGAIISSTGFCYLKSNLTNPVKTPSLDPNGTAPGMDYSGGPGIELAKTLASSLEDCKTQCEAVYNCIAAIYRESTGRCYMKSALLTANYFVQVDPTAILVVPQAPVVESTSWVALPKVQYLGNDTSVTTNVTAPDCVSSCASTSGCVGVVYIPVGGICNLKSVLSTPTVNNYGVILYLQPGVGQAPSLDSTVGGFKKPIGTAAANCRSTCQNTPGCVAAIWRDVYQRCYLNSYLGSFMVDPTALLLVA